MKPLKNMIYESAIYNFILAFCRFALQSFFLKPQINMVYKEKKEIFIYTGIYHLLIGLGKKLDLLFDKLRAVWESSLIIGFFNKCRRNLIQNSFVGRMIGELNIVYLIPLYIYMDVLLRGVMPSVASVWDELLFILIILWIIARRVLGSKKIQFTSLDFPIYFFAGVYLLLVFINSPEMDVAIEGYRAVVQYIFWFFLVVQLVDTKKIAYRMIWLFIIGIGLLGLHGVYQYVTGAPMLGNWVDAGETIRTRAYSIVRSPNALASLLVLNIPLGISMFIAEKDILKKLVALFFTLCMGLGLLFTFSRGAWMVCFFTILVFLFFIGKRMIVPILTVLVAAVIYVNTLWSRISYLFSSEYKSKAARGGRTFRWITTLNEWAESKVLGLGVGRYGGAVATHHKLTPFYTDNYYIKTLAESGLVGLSAFLALIFITLWQIVRCIKSTLSQEYRI